MAVTNVLTSYKFIVGHLEQLVETSERVSSDSKAKAKGFLAMLKSRDLLSFLLFMVDVLSPLKGTSPFCFKKRRLFWQINIRQLNVL